MNNKLLASLLIAANAVLATACATSPLGRNQLAILPANQMANMGAQAFQQQKLSKPIDRSPADNNYVHCVADNLLRSQGGTGRWEVVVFQDNSPNAFALPGNKIGVHTGIFLAAKNQNQLAAVIGHEVSHVLANHSNERLSQQMAVNKGLNILSAAANPTSPAGRTAMGLLGLGAQYGVLLPYSRLQESEADLYGLDLMANAGFDPREAVQLWRNMEALSGKQTVEFLSTHPSDSHRIAAIEQRLPQAMALYQKATAAGLTPHCQAPN